MFEIVLLRSFAAVAKARSFTAAAAALGLSQPAVSQHVRRLEREAGQILLQRDTSSVALTASGAVMARFADEILGLHDQARAYYAGVADQTVVRLGVSEDLALTKLPVALRRLARGRSRVQVELTVGLTSRLYPKLDAGQLDLVLAKRRDGDDRGKVVRREPLVWMAHREFRLPADGLIPLVGYPQASITTTMAVSALSAAGLRWRMSCTSETLSGVWCGLQAALGISAQAAFLIEAPPRELVRCPPSFSLPPLRSVDFVLLGRSAHLHGPVAEVAKLIQDGDGGIWSAREVSCDPT
jgi:DNA-binding transcriptional LysR family regulator